MFTSHLSYLAVSYLNASQMSNVTIVLLYAALLVIVTSMISLRTNDPDPMLAGRNMPWWLIAASIVGTSISSIAFLAIPAKGFVFDFYYLFGNFFGNLLGTIFGVVCFVTFLRKTRNASIYTLLQDRFGRWSAVYASCAFIIFSTLRMGVITCLVANGIHLICGVDIVSVMLLTGIMVMFYTYMSGIEGVIWTDFFQTAILVFAGIVSIFFLLKGMSYFDDGILTSIQVASSTLEKGFDVKVEWSLLLTSVLFFFSTTAEFYASNQGIAQRYLVARSNRQAKWGLIVGGILVPCCSALFFSIGVLLYLTYQVNPDFLIGSTEGDSSAFAHFIANHFPDGLKGLAIVGILAAAMSTIDTGINSSSTVLICNLYEPYSKASGHRQSLLVMQILRGSSVIFGVAGILAAYLIHLRGTSVLEFFWQGTGIITAGVFGLFLLMRMSKKAGPKAAVTGLVCGSALAFWMTFTAELDHPLASPFHYMLTLPVSAVVTALTGIGVSYFCKKSSPVSLEMELPSSIAQAQLAQKRKRAKKNIFSDSLRPKPFYRLYACIAAIAGVVLYIEAPNIGLVALDLKVLLASMGCLVLVALMPVLVNNTYNKRYACFYLTLLGFALPFVGTIALFTHPTEHAFSYFYLVTIAALGTMVGWTMLGLVSMIATAGAAQMAVFLYPQVGIPDNWAMIAIGALAVFTYFAMDAAKENLVTERMLGRIHHIVGKIYDKVIGVSVGLAQSNKPLSLEGISHLAKSAGDVKLMLGALLGATDINPEETKLELSVRETLLHVLKRCSKKAYQSVRIEGDADFNVLGNREIFESIVAHVLDNAFYYVEKGEATTVVCILNKDTKTLSILNDGPTIAPQDMPYIFDLGYTVGKDSLGLGLTYCKKMLEGMRSGIRLISKPNDPWVQFCLYFPKYAQLPPESQRYDLKDNEDDTSNADSFHYPSGNCC